MIDAETGDATTDISNFKGDLDDIEKTVTTTVKVNVDSRNWDNWTPKQKQAGIVYSATGITRQRG